MLQRLLQHRGVLPAMVFVLLSVTYALTNPYLQSPDEAAHVDLVRALEQREGWPDVRDRRISEEITASRARLAWDRHAYARRAEDASPRADRPSFEELEGSGSPGGINHISQHPPLYYVAVAAIASGTGTPVFAFVEGTVDRVVGWYRIVNAVLVGFAMLGAAVAVRVGGGGAQAQLVAGASILAVPQLAYLAGSVNNDNGLVLTVGLLTPVIMRILRGDASRRLGAVGGLLAGAAATVKIFGAAAVVWLGAACVVAWWRFPDRRRRITGQAIVAGTTTALVGGAWWVRNLVLYGRVQPAGMQRDVEPLPGFDHAIWDWVQGYVPRMSRSFFGNFGYLDSPLPLWVVVGATAAFSLLLAVAVVRTVRAGASYRLLLLLPLILLVVATALHNYAVVFENLGGRFAAAQGRYWFGAIVPTAVFVALPLRERWAPAVTTGAAVGIQLLGLGVVVRSFYAGDDLAERMTSVLSWSPWPVGVSVAVFAATVVVLALLAVTAIWSGGDGAGDDASGTGLDSRSTSPMERSGTVDNEAGQDI